MVFNCGCCSTNVGFFGQWPEVQNQVTFLDQIINIPAKWAPDYKWSYGPPQMALMALYMGNWGYLHPRNKWTYDYNPILKTGCPGFTLKGINGFPTTPSRNSRTSVRPSGGSEQKARKASKSEMIPCKPVWAESQQSSHGQKTRPETFH